VADVPEVCVSDTALIVVDVLNPFDCELADGAG